MTNFEAILKPDYVYTADGELMAWVFEGDRTLLMPSYYGLEAYPSRFYQDN